MTGLGIMMIAIVALAVGYFGYARWLEKTWGIDPNRPTPAVEKNGGKDFSPARLSLLCSAGRQRCFG